MALQKKYGCDKPLANIHVSEFISKSQLGIKPLTDEGKDFIFQDDHQSKTIANQTFSTASLELQMDCIMHFPNTFCHPMRLNLEIPESPKKFSQFRPSNFLISNDSTFKGSRNRISHQTIDNGCMLKHRVLFVAVIKHASDTG